MRPDLSEAIQARRRSLELRQHELKERIAAARKQREKVPPPCSPFEAALAEAFPKLKLRAWRKPRKPRAVRRRAIHVRDSSRPLCRHCSIAVITRPRGLCWHCYHLPGVREQFEPTSKAGRRGIGNGYAGYRLPDSPTTAAPGSPGKLEAIEQRVRERRSLWHPGDARFEGDPRPLGG